MVRVSSPHDALQIGRTSASSLQRWERMPVAEEILVPPMQNHAESSFSRCGLKLFPCKTCYLFGVAPHAGAWIEIAIADVSILKLIQMPFSNRNSPAELFSGRFSQIHPRVYLKVSLWLNRGLCPQTPGIYRLLFSQG